MGQTFQPEARVRRRHRHKRRTQWNRLRHSRHNFLAMAVALLGLALFHAVFIVSPFEPLPLNEPRLVFGWLLGCAAAGVLCSFAGWSLWKWESSFLAGLDATLRQVLRGKPLPS